ncbi:MAG: permease [Pseudomonadota bacterium]
MLKHFADWLTYDVFSLVPKSLPAEAVNFFVYDTIKIFLLLSLIIFTVSFIRSFLPPERIRKILSGRNEYLGNVLAALFGIITPFCSCSAIPLFLGFVEAGVPLGVTFSFLVSSPMVNEVALILLLGLFGWRIALIYAFSGVVIAIVSGIIIGRLKLEHLVEDFVYQVKVGQGLEPQSMSWSERAAYARGYTVDVLKRVWLYIIIGIGLGAWMHGYVPADFLARYAGRDKWYAVPLVTLIGIPLYSNAAGIVPLISVLTEKGISMGSALAFVMAVTGLSLPEFMILRKVMKVKLLAVFAGIVGLGIMFTGYLFNFIL